MKRQNRDPRKPKNPALKKLYEYYWRRPFPRGFIRHCENHLKNVASVSQVAKQFNIPPMTIRRWCEEGKIIARQVDNKGTWFIAIESVNRRLGGMNEEIENN